MAAEATGGVIRTKIVKGDTVVLRRGREKGKRGTVKHVFPKAGEATVEGLNVVKRHTKQGYGGAKASGIYEKEAPIPLSALSYVCVKCDKPTRIAYKIGPQGKQRVCRHCGEPAPEPVKGR